METSRHVDVRFSGHVQGVGFRYRARQIAVRYDVSGFVRNLENGDVQLVAEGQPDVLQEFLGEIEAQLAPYIRRKTVAWSDPHGQFNGFVIRA